MAGEIEKKGRKPESVLTSRPVATKGHRDHFSFSLSLSLSLSSMAATRSYFYYCTSCETQYHYMTQKGASEEALREKYNIPKALFSENPSNCASGICPRCASEYRNPYLIYLGPGVPPARAIVRPSIHFTCTCSPLVLALPFFIRWFSRQTWKVGTRLWIACY